MAKKYYSRSEKEKLAKKLAAVVAVFVIVCTATVVIGHIVDNQKMNTGQKDAAAASDIVTINGVKCKPNWDVENVKFFCNIFSKKIFNIVYLLFIIYNDII